MLSRRGKKFEKVQGNLSHTNEKVVRSQNDPVARRVSKRLNFDSDFGAITRANFENLEKKLKIDDSELLNFVNKFFKRKLKTGGPIYTGVFGVKFFNRPRNTCQTWGWRKYQVQQMCCNN